MSKNYTDYLLKIKQSFKTIDGLPSNSHSSASRVNKIKTSADERMKLQRIEQIYQMTVILSQSKIVRNDHQSDDRPTAEKAKRSAPIATLER